jgi:hypothetical protein
MEFYKPRKLTFKAWNKDARLLMRLDSISCVKGELLKKDHILLQFTGLLDKQLDELYEMDVVLLDSVKYVIRWSDDNSGWSYVILADNGTPNSLTPEVARKMVRLCNYFESAGL